MTSSQHLLTYSAKHRSVHLSSSLAQGTSKGSFDLGLASPWVSLQGVPDTNSGSFSNLDLLSSSNVKPEDNRFWAHMGAIYIVSAVALVLLLGFSKDVSRLRARFMSTLPRGGESHSVLITDIPCLDGHGAAAPVKAMNKLRHTISKVRAPGQSDFKDTELGPSYSSPYEGYKAIEDEVLDPWADARNQLAQGDAESMVRNEMETTYGADKVVAVNVVYDTNKVDPKLQRYDQLKSQLSDITDDFISKIKRRKTNIKRKQITLLPALATKWAKEKYQVGAKPVKVDALEYLPGEMDHLYQEMKADRESIKDSHVPAAFVTFNDRACANSAATGLQTYDETAWRVQPAPGDDEIIWNNLGMRYKQRSARTIIVWAVFIVILIFYLPVTAAIQAVVNLDNARKIPGLGKVADIPFITQVLQGILPGLVLKIFLIILPPILALMAKFEGKISVSTVDFSVVRRYFIFQVFATFIYQFLVGSALSNIQGMISGGISTIVPLLGVSAAQTATFFMSYIMINALGVGMGLLRVVPLIIYFIKDKLAGTERAKYRNWAKQPFSFGTNVANHTIILLLGLAFTCLAPLIAPFCLLYFTLALMVQKYQLIYVVTLPYQAAGRMWIDCFNQIMTGIYFMQAMGICVLLVKRFNFALLLLPLIVMTVAFHVVNLSLFKRPWTLMSLKEAAVLDARDHGDVSPSEVEAVKKKYLSPVFKVDEEEHVRVINEAIQVDKQLKGEPNDLRLEEEEEDAVKKTEDV
eukprot:GHUV01008778.1.p1 GENE.GHUV01008778.1~~GHUV01008778.1.p1  ORF type:complete len:750 (+),score=167.74 GHUV01008778.1:924-3173(+)